MNTATGREIVYDPEFYQDLCYWRDHDLSTAMRVVDLMEEITTTPGEGRGRPKRLASLPGVWTRRVTQTHRIIYVVGDDELRFVSCRGHEVPQTLRDEVRQT